jgi:AraC-like DNA-binding protein
MHGRLSFSGGWHGTATPVVSAGSQGARRGDGPLLKSLSTALRAAPGARRRHTAWLRFIDACQVAVGRSQLESETDAQTLVPSLVDAAARLQTYAERLLGSVIVSQIADRIGATAARSGSAAAGPADALRAITAAASANPQEAMDARAAAVLRYVQSRHLSPDCRLVTIARELRMSRTHLSRLVLRETGFTFRHHLQVARMHSAARLLTHTDMSIKEIASATGYEHVPSFDRKFGRHFHLTPGQFRRMGSPTAADQPKRKGDPTG